ncbi:hypothetical protein K470DRAFT_265336 [Piedraia hortae CBS 480.64]|uniref:Uncharacterized protein n=1 Tax=Piedraia hortae CBS 480.64 TaxID=1314780 RepID=A0A6A7BXA2_9PEZI|nr:hypothetical protein K470DRAFT_265336 [Piedraia hortae CBS 480.64]
MNQGHSMEGFSHQDAPTSLLEALSLESAPVRRAAPGNISSHSYPLSDDLACRALPHDGPSPASQGLPSVHCYKHDAGLISGGYQNSGRCNGSALFSSVPQGPANDASTCHDGTCGKQDSATDPDATDSESEWPAEFHEAVQHIRAETANKDDPHAASRSEGNAKKGSNQRKGLPKGPKTMRFSINPGCVSVVPKADPPGAPKKQFVSLSDSDSYTPSEPLVQQQPFWQYVATHYDSDSE